MKQTVSRAFVALVLASAIARPASAANKEQQQMMADIRMLQEQAQQLQNLIGALNTTLNATLSEAMKAVNARLDDQTGSNRKSFADQKLVIDTLASDLKVVREKVDDNNVRIGSLSQEVDALRQGLQQLGAARPSVATESTGSTGAVVPGDAPPQNAGAPAPPPLPIGTSPQRLYDQALNSYSIGLYDLAIDGFRSYIRSFPKSDMADDAQLQIGHSYLAEGKNEKAVEEYDTVIRMYPGGNAVPDAYYKKGMALTDLRQVEQARAAFETVVKNFPNSDAAGLARQRLMSPLFTAPRK
jgi:tol-pal system protein YbgF